MATNGDRWRGWVGVVIAVVLAAGIVMADREIQRGIARVHDAALADANATELSINEVAAIIGQTQAAVELSVIAADDAGLIELDDSARDALLEQLAMLSAEAGFSLEVGLDRATRFDIRMDTLLLLSGRPAPMQIAPTVASLHSTIADAATTGTDLLTADGTVSGRDIDSMRSRLNGAQALRVDVETLRVNSIAELDDIRSSVRWRIHLLFGVALLSLGWFGYQGWRGAIRRSPADPTNPTTD